MAITVVPGSVLMEVTQRPAVATPVVNGRIYDVSLSAGNNNIRPMQNQGGPRRQPRGLDSGTDSVAMDRD
jgi:hypothetical protein